MDSRNYVEGVVLADNKELAKTHFKDSAKIEEIDLSSEFMNSIKVVKIIKSEKIPTCFFQNNDDASICKRI